VRAREKIKGKRGRKREQDRKCACGDRENKKKIKKEAKAQRIVSIHPF